MKATIIIDNISHNSLLCEWGLSVHISHNNFNILLDTGTTGIFAENSKTLGIDLENVDYAVLSHAHYDHADGMGEFFKNNSKASFYIRSGISENCYRRKSLFKHKYIGIKQGYLQEFKDRIVYVEGDYKLDDGVYLIPHKTPNLSKIGKKAHMYVRKNNRWQPDDFSHEQSLVIDTDKGLVIFNSCSHGGADNIINEVASTFPNKKIYAIIGGFHLFESTDKAIIALAQRIKETGIQQVITGHCTGEHAFDILKENLGDCVQQIHCGMVIEV